MRHDEQPVTVQLPGETLEQENRRLKRALAEKVLEVDFLQGALQHVRFIVAHLPLLLSFYRYSDASIGRMSTGKIQRSSWKAVAWESSCNLRDRGLIPRIDEFICLQLVPLSVERLIPCICGRMPGGLHPWQFQIG